MRYQVCLKQGSFVYGYQSLLIRFNQRYNCKKIIEKDKCYELNNSI